MMQMEMYSYAEDDLIFFIFSIVCYFLTFYKRSCLGTLDVRKTDNQLIISMCNELL